MENTYSKESIREEVLKDKRIQSFISDPTWYVDICYLDQPIRITKEEVGVDYYYMSPLNKDADNSVIHSYMDMYIKVVSELIEEKRKHELIH